METDEPSATGERHTAQCTAKLHPRANARWHLLYNRGPSRPYLWLATRLLADHAVVLVVFELSSLSKNNKK